MGRKKKQLSQYSCGDGTHGCSWMWEWKSKEERNCGSLTFVRQGNRCNTGSICSLLSPWFVAKVHLDKSWIQIHIQV